MSSDEYCNVQLKSCVSRSLLVVLICVPLPLRLHMVHIMCQHCDAPSSSPLLLLGVPCHGQIMSDTLTPQTLPLTKTIGCNVDYITDSTLFFVCVIFMGNLTRWVAWHIGGRREQKHNKVRHLVGRKGCRHQAR